MISNKFGWFSTVNVFRALVLRVVLDKFLDRFWFDFTPNTNVLVIIVWHNLVLQLGHRCDKKWFKSIHIHLIPNSFKMNPIKVEIFETACKVSFAWSTNIFFDTVDFGRLVRKHAKITLGCVVIIRIFCPWLFRAWTNFFEDFIFFDCLFTWRFLKALDNGCGDGWRSRNLFDAWFEFHFTCDSHFSIKKQTQIIFQCKFFWLWLCFCASQVHLFKAK